MVEKNSYPFLNDVRWISALLVAFGHFYLFFIIPDFDISVSVWGFLFTLAASLRGAAVIVFFVLSGFLIGGGLLVNDQVNYRRYFISRFFRIYPVLIPSLILTIALDYFGKTYLSYQTYSISWPSGVFGGEAPTMHHEFANLLSTLLAIPHIIPPYGSNGPLWSLAYELFFYLIAPLLSLRIRSRQRPIIVASVVAVILFLFIGADSSVFWLSWFFGALSRAHLDRVDVRAQVFFYGLTLAAISFIVYCKLTGSAIPSIFLYFIFSMVVALLFTNSRTLSMTIHPQMSVLLSSFSFSFYVVHMPILFFLGALGIAAEVFVFGGVAFSFLAFVYVIFCLLIVVGVAYIFSKFFEEGLSNAMRRLFSEKI